jgi:hypothetical protein
VLLLFPPVGTTTTTAARGGAGEDEWSERISVGSRSDCYCYDEGHHRFHLDDVDSVALAAGGEDSVVANANAGSGGVGGNNSRAATPVVVVDRDDDGGDGEGDTDTSAANRAVSGPKPPRKGPSVEVVVLAFEPRKVSLWKVPLLLLLASALALALLLLLLYTVAACSCHWCCCQWSPGCHPIG